MFVAPGPRGLLAGCCAAVLIFAAATTLTGMRGDDATDQVITGSINSVAPMQASLASPAPAKAASIKIAPLKIAPVVEPARALTAAVSPAAVRSLRDQPIETTPEEILPAQVAPPKPSAGFGEAMTLLDAGDHAGAFELAAGLDSDAERRTIQWAAIHYGKGNVPHAEVIRFSTEAPGLAGGTTFKTRLEQAVARAGADYGEIIKTLGGAMPQTINAQIALASAYVADGQRERAAGIARAIWSENFLDRRTEDRVLAKLGKLLDRDAHWARAVHLMMHDRASGVERLMKFMSEDQKTLAVARNAVSRKLKTAKKLLDGVPAAMQEHPVFLFSRAQRARQFDLWDDAIDWLDKAKGTPPDAAEFWYERRTLTRKLLAKGDTKRAYRAAAGFKEGPEGRVVDAQFHAGWIAMTFLKDAKLAAPHFELMLANSTLPDSVTQAGYWLGRARTATGDEAGAAEAFATAAKYPTVYYGQLAAAELGHKGVDIRGLPEWEESEPGFEARDEVRAVRLLAAQGKKNMALTLLRSFAFDLTEGGELLLAARLAQSMGSHHLTISIADTAERRGAPLDLFNFPKDGLPAKSLASTDTAAVYAVARQESRFQLDAVSSAGARGLMQLMPATAKETAAKVGLAYSAKRLTTDGAYNALLGSTYLKAQLKAFDGSLLLAAAAYNAGAGNARKWIRAFGDPRSDAVDPVVWVERIPFQETRKYVQRVLGNYLVYRARLGEHKMTIREAMRRIPGQG